MIFIIKTVLLLVSIYLFLKTEEYYSQKRTIYPLQLGIISAVWTATILVFANY
jgi:hypothetical protein